MTYFLESYDSNTELFSLLEKNKRMLGNRKLLEKSKKEGRKLWQRKKFP